MSASDTIGDGVTPGTWSASGLELRTTAPKTYIWPDCDASDPCVIYHYSRPAQPLEADGPLFKFWVRPSLANNLLVLTITHPGTISSISDAGNNTWASGPSTAGSNDTTDVRYVCGAPANSGGEIDVTLNTAIGVSNIMQVTYNEISGIATSSCNDGTATSAINQSVGAIQPGAITTTQTDLIYTYGIDGSENQTNGFPSGWEMGDDLSAQLFNSPNDSYISTVSVQASGTINPTLYISGSDINEQSTRWQLVAQAFKASNGAGTPPPSGGAWVVRDIISWNNVSAALSILPAPTNGNVIEVDTTHYQTITNLTTLEDNQGGTYSANPIKDPTADPQMYYDCLGTAGVNRDRTLAYTPGSYSSLLHYYDISGAKTTGGSTGCVGNQNNDETGEQNTIDNANIVTSAFSTPWSFTPMLNGSAYSAVLVDIGFGTGPPSGPCNSGGVTPPTCTNDMGSFVTGSVWATSMGDGSHYTSGDEYGWYFTNSATAASFDMFMANSAGQSGGGTFATGGALEILGEPASGPTAQVATPTLSPAGGTYSAAQSVTISDATAGAQIYYTTDGSTPSSASTLYTGTAIEVSSTTTIQAIAVASGLPNSAVASATYTLQVATPTLSPAGATYSAAQSVTISDATAGAQIYYTTDGSTPSSASTLYTGTAIEVSSTTTIQAIAVASGLPNSAVASATYTLQVATPTLSPAGGTYSAAQSVTISDATAGAQIYYTTDGSTPSSASTLYTGTAIEVSSTTTIQAIAVASGLPNSAVASATYRIDMPHRHR